MSNWICDKCGANYIDVSHQEPSVLKEELEIRKLKELLRECREVIYNLIDDEPCRYDHHGYCQAHNWLSNDVCPHKQGKELIPQINNAIGEKK